MTQGKERFWYVTGHGDVDMSGRVIPVNLETEIVGTGPVFGEGILGGEGGKEMIGVWLREEFNTEIINRESERSASIDVAPEARSMFNREVAIRGEVLSELFVREDGGFFEAIHTLADFDVYISLGVEMCVC